MAAYSITVNGRARTVESADPDQPLLYILRNGLDLTGPKYGCGLGQCGSCTVIIDGDAQRSCQVTIAGAANRAITTIEGVAPDGLLSPLQQALHEEHGLQCGFCTPGIVLTMEAWLADNPAPTDEEIREALSGNLCRCTGYHNIVAAVAKAAARRSEAAE